MIVAIIAKKRGNLYYSDDGDSHSGGDEDVDLLDKGHPVYHRYD